MKIRYWMAGYTLGMVIIMVLMCYSLKQRPDSQRDMVNYNRRLRQVEQALVREKVSEKIENTPAIEQIEYNVEAEWADRIGKIEQTYDCTILLLADRDYETRFNELLQERAVVFDYYVNRTIVGKIAWKEGKQVLGEMQDRLLRSGFLYWAVLLVAGYMLLVLVYIYFLRPFRKLERFAAQIAKGNFDFPLPVQKYNFFGAFTESFDIMREELKRARESEYQANRSKKELVAELSHDIKTPVSTIKATCEVLQVREKNEDTLNKVKIIAAKADTVDRLIGNLFHATMEELQILKTEPAEEGSGCILEMFGELKYYGKIVLENPVPSCLLFFDRLRLEQVIDNIVNNSYKYAESTVTVSFEERAEGIRIRIRDEGPGVPEEELALITEKYFRGTNAKGKTGSGLGLFLSKMFMEQMGGGMEYYNQNGFVVELFVRKAGRSS